jgi:Zn-finger nucleic acid-binding protein
MLCPICKEQLKSAILHNTEVDYCPKCLGLWFEEEELNWAKNEKDENLRWLNIDLWQDSSKFKICRGIRLCPFCRVPLYEVRYENSSDSPNSGQVIVDVCNLCHGIWLDRAEFKKIINYLYEKADYEIINHYIKNLFQQLAEVFIGPKALREEILDFLTVLKLLNYKFLIQYPAISKIILELPK